GFADHFVSSAHLPALIEALCAAGGKGIGEVLGALGEDAGEGTLAARQGAIDRHFAAAGLEEILAALERAEDAWALSAAAELKEKSPKSLKLTHAAVGRAVSAPSLEAALTVEYRLSVRLFEDGEFPEGVRALLIDKDRKPKWRPPRLADVSDALVERYLAPLPADEELRF